MSRSTNRRFTGPALVSLGAAGWGAESLFRTRLDQLQLPAYSIVLVEHVLQVLYTLPWLVAGLRAARRARDAGGALDRSGGGGGGSGGGARVFGISRRALVYVLLSGGVGSSLGTV